MDWVKEIGPKGGASEGWREDFPLEHNLPQALGIDCSRLEIPVHPMFAVRLRTFVDWHRAAGREVVVTPPCEPRARRRFSSMAIDPELAVEPEEDAIVPVTRMTEFREVEDVAERTQEVLEYQLTEVSSMGQAAFMAVSELCNNAVDHGQNSLGAYAAVQRSTEPRRQVSIAISDLGIGVPEHIRQRYPEWSDDGWAIAHATEESISGTGDDHRGIGFSAVHEAALTSALHAARLDVLSANGFCRLQLVQEKRKVEVFPATRFRRGTWITYDLVSV